MVDLKVGLNLNVTYTLFKNERIESMHQAEWLANDAQAIQLTAEISIVLIESPQV